MVNAHEDIDFSFSFFVAHKEWPEHGFFLRFLIEISHFHIGDPLLGLLP